MREETITLGGHQYKVVGQKIGRLMHKLGDELSDVLTLDTEEISGAEALPVQAHTILEVFIPTLMPVHEFLGYPSQDARERADYEPEKDTSPTADEIVDAFKAISRVNGGEVLRNLKALIPAEVIQRAVQTAIATFSETTLSATPGSSPTSPQANGASGPTSSGTEAPTKERSAA